MNASVDATAPVEGWTARVPIVVGWAAVTLAAAASGGADSPFTALYFPLIVHLATTHTPAVLGQLAVLTVGAHLGMLLLDPESLTPTIVVTTALALTAWISIRFARTHRQRVQEQTALARVDGLTGCLNQRAFREVLEGEVARATRFAHPLTLVLIDLDRFKDVNDRRGHQAGDEVLANMGQLLRTSVRAIDVVGRIGGDEFAVLLLETGRRDAGSIAERILGRARAGAGDTTTTVSLGVASLTEGSSATMLLADADVALYAAKRAGRDGLHVHTGD